MNTKTLMTAIVPLVFFVILIIADRPFPDFLPGLTSSEMGLVENMQALLMIAAFGVAAILFSWRFDVSHWIKAWIGIGAICSLYVFLEEISYGQHYLNWATPEYWAAINDQNETNLHNTSSWLDQKPRILLEIGVVVGGIIVPILRRYRPKWLPERFHLILPDNALFVTAVLVFFSRLYERVVSAMNAGHMDLFERTSEVQELYFYYFILLYFICLSKKLSPYRKIAAEKQLINKAAL